MAEAKKNPNIPPAKSTPPGKEKEIRKLNFEVESMH